MRRCSFYPVAMTSTRSDLRRTRAVAACLALTVLLAGCGPADTETEEAETPSNAMPQPEVDGDDTVRLPLAMLSPVVQDPENTQEQEIEVARTEPFGCGDTISVIQSVPMLTEEPAVAALEYLTSDELYSHGDPAFSNPLSASDELSVESVELEDETVTVELSGQPTTTSECESWQILTQIETTARVATGATFSEVNLDGQPLAETLGLAPVDTPLEIREVTF